MPLSPGLRTKLDGGILSEKYLFLFELPRQRYLWNPSYVFDSTCAISIPDNNLCRVADERIFCPKVTGSHTGNISRLENIINWIISMHAPNFAFDLSLFTSFIISSQNNSYICTFGSGIPQKLQACLALFVMD